ncbi:MAG: hypothetical protein WCD86_00665 [Ktedonobacteraceae bacterium]
MSVLIDTVPVVCLPHQILLGEGNHLYFLPDTNDANTIVVQRQRPAGELELPDMLVDIIWCYNSENETLVIGSEYGRYIYFIDVLRMKMTQMLDIQHTEDKEWNKCILQVTLDQRRVIVHIEYKVMILTWQGTILLEHSLAWNDSLKLIEQNALTFYNPGADDDSEFTIPIPE